MKTVILTLDAGSSDLAIREREGGTGLRRWRLERIANEAGRSLSHRQMIVKRWLWGMKFSEISRQTNHSIEAIANYVEKFKRGICLAKDNHEINTIAFLVKISASLAQQYYDLYQTLDSVTCREKEPDELVKKKRLFNSEKFVRYDSKTRQCKTVSFGS
jgi:hypothetical protein